jgi:hypothetical protein
MWPWAAVFLVARLQRKRAEAPGGSLSRHNEARAAARKPWQWRQLRRATRPELKKTVSSPPASMPAAISL